MQSDRISTGYNDLRAFGIQRAIHDGFSTLFYTKSENRYGEEQSVGQESFVG